MCVPSGITDGSTAATPQPTGRPVEVLPPRAYPVATTVSDLPAVTTVVRTTAVAASVTGADFAVSTTVRACAARALATAEAIALRVIRCWRASELTYAARCARVCASAAAD